MPLECSLRLIWPGNASQPVIKFPLSVVFFNFPGSLEIFRFGPGYNFSGKALDISLYRSYNDIGIFACCFHEWYLDFGIYVKTPHLHADFNISLFIGNLGKILNCKLIRIGVSWNHLSLQLNELFFIRHKIGIISVGFNNSNCLLKIREGGSFFSRLVVLTKRRKYHRADNPDW